MFTHVSISSRPGTGKMSREVEENATCTVHRGTGVSDGRN